MLVSSSMGSSSSSSVLTNLLCIELLIELLTMKHTLAMRDLASPAGLITPRSRNCFTACDGVQLSACWSYVNLCYSDVDTAGENRLRCCWHSCMYKSGQAYCRLDFDVIHTWALQIVTGVVVYGRNTPGSRHLQSGQTVTCKGKTDPGLQQPLGTISL